MDKEKDNLENSFVSAINLAIAFHRRAQGKKSVDLKSILAKKLDQSMPEFAQSNEYTSIKAPEISSYALAKIPPTSNVNANMYWDVIRGVDGEGSALASDFSNTTIYLPHSEAHLSGYDLRNDILTYWDALNQALEQHCDRDKTALDNAIYGNPGLRNDDSSEEELLFNVITEDDSIDAESNLRWPQDDNELDAIIASEGSAEVVADTKNDVPVTSAELPLSSAKLDESSVDFTPSHEISIHNISRDNLTDPKTKPQSHFGTANPESIVKTRAKLQDSFIVSAMFAGGLFDNVNDNVEALKKAHKMYTETPDAFKKLIKSSVIEKSHAAFLMGLIAKPNETYEVAKMSDAMKQDVSNNLKLNRVVLFGQSAMSGEDLASASYSISKAHVKPLSYTQYFGDDGNETTIQIVHITHILEKAAELYGRLMSTVQQTKQATLDWVNNMTDGASSITYVIAYAWLVSSARKLHKEMERLQRLKTSNVEIQEEVDYTQKKIELAHTYNTSMIESYKQSLDKYKKILANLIVRVKKFTALELKKAKDSVPYDTIRADYKRFIPFVINTINEQLNFSAIQIELKESVLLTENIASAADALENMKPNTGFYETALQIQTTIINLLTKFDEEMTRVYNGYIQAREKLMNVATTNLKKAVVHLEKEKIVSLNKGKMTEQIRKYAQKAEVIKNKAPQRLHDAMERASNVVDPNSAFFYDFTGEGLARTVELADPLVDYVHYICRHIEDFRAMTRELTLFVMPAIVVDFLNQLHDFNERNSRIAIDHAEDIVQPFAPIDPWTGLKSVQKMLIKRGHHKAPRTGDASFNLMDEYEQWLLVNVENEIYAAVYGGKNASDMDQVLMEDVYMFGGAAQQVDPTLLSNPKTRQQQLARLLKISEDNLKKTEIEFAGEKNPQKKQALENAIMKWEENINTIKHEIEVLVATKQRNDSNYLHQARNWIFFDANKQLPNTLKNLYYECNGLIAYLTSDIVNTKDTKFMKALVSFGMSRAWPRRKTLKYQKYNLEFLDAGSPQERGDVLAKAVDTFALLMLYSYNFDDNEDMNISNSLNGIHEIVQKAKRGDISATVLTKSRKINLEEGFKNMEDDQVLSIWTLTQWLRDELRCTPGGLSLQPPQYAVKPNGICGQNPFIRTNNILKQKNAQPIQFANSSVPNPKKIIDLPSNDELAEILSAQQISNEINADVAAINKDIAANATVAESDDEFSDEAVFGGTKVFKALPERYNTPHGAEVEIGTCLDYIARTGAKARNPCMKLLKGLTAHPPK